MVERRASEGDRRRRYVRLRPGVLAQLQIAPALPAVCSPLFVCTRNSARSPFAAALWRQTSGRQAWSAGSDPATRVHPLAVEVAAGYDVDLSTATPRGDDEVTEEPDAVVSVCGRAREHGAPFAAPTLHWSVPDPAAGRRSCFSTRWSSALLWRR